MKPGSYQRTPEIKQKMKKANLHYYQKLIKEDILDPRSGRKNSPEARKRMRQARIRFHKRLEREGRPHPLKGRKIPEDQKEKMRLAKLGMYDGCKNPAWKGGRKKSSGYIFIWSPHHPYANTANYVKENRLVVEKYIGRHLKPEESCHHRNGIKDDNRPENLMAFKSDSLHQLFEHGHLIDSSDIIFDGRKL